MADPVRFGVLGDVHGHFEADEARALSSGGLDAVLIVGDLAGLRFEPTLAIARRLAGLTVPALAIAGNHDGPNPVQLLAEVTGAPVVGAPFTEGLLRRDARLREAFGAVQVGGYAVHRFGRISVVTGRPWSMGGPSLAFAGAVAKRYGADTLEASTRKLCDVVDRSPTDDLVFLAHNGPTGLGERRDDIWGCDFRSGGGDWGDADLEGAVVHARRAGKRVLAVVAGHMHRRLRGGGERVRQVERDGTLYVNAAEVRRIRRGEHHHVRLELTDTAHAEDVWL